MKTLIATTFFSLVAAAISTAAMAETMRYAVDPTHTSVTFEALHFGTSTLRGRIDKKEGVVEIDRAAKTGKAEMTLELTSVDTGVPPLDKHLMSKDFFDTEQFKAAVFIGDKMSFDGDKVTSIDGTLRMLGKSNPVSLKATRFNCYQNPMLKREVCGGDFEAKIQRSQWGMTYGLPGIPDDIRLLIQIEAIKQ